jgi:hypothetical protein
MFQSLLQNLLKDIKERTVLANKAYYFVLSIMKSGEIHGQSKIKL